MVGTEIYKGDDETSNYQIIYMLHVCINHCQQEPTIAMLTQG